MKVVGILFTFVMLVTSVTNTYAFHCQSESSHCSESLEFSSQLDENHQQEDEAKHNTPHARCKSSCSHTQALLQGQKFIDYSIPFDLTFEAYQFRINQVFIDGLLRPPLA